MGGSEERGRDKGRRQVGEGDKQEEEEVEHAYQRRF
jgi:hypothetical protein